MSNSPLKESNNLPTQTKTSAYGAVFSHKAKSQKNSNKPKNPETKFWKHHTKPIKNILKKHLNDDCTNIILDYYVGIEKQSSRRYLKYLKACALREKLVKGCREIWNNWKLCYKSIIALLLTIIIVGSIFDIFAYVISIIAFALWQSILAKLLWDEQKKNINIRPKPQHTLHGIIFDFVIGGPIMYVTWGHGRVLMVCTIAFFGVWFVCMTYFLVKVPMDRAQGEKWNFEIKDNCEIEMETTYLQGDVRSVTTRPITITDFAGYKNWDVNLTCIKFDWESAHGNYIPLVIHSIFKDLEENELYKFAQHEEAIEMKYDDLAKKRYFPIYIVTTVDKRQENWIV